MLILSRKRDETIIIGDDNEITVVDIRGANIRLGIKAPSSIAVHRKEVYEAIKRENESLPIRPKISGDSRPDVTRDYAGIYGRGGYMLP